LVKVSADDGQYGVGEATSQTRYLGETSDQIEASLRAYDLALRGCDPENFARAHQVMEATVSGGMPGGRTGRSAVDMALYDLVGKARGVPVHALLGGAYRHEFELLTNLYFTTPETMADGCKKFVAQGFKGLKVKVGDELLAQGWSRGTLELELAKLEASLAVVPRDVYVDADANQAWNNAKWTVALLRRFGQHDNLSIEQPLHYADLSGAAFVRAHSPIPIILDESVWSPRAMMQIAELGACDRIVLKLNRVGGFFPALQVVAICEAAGIGVSVDTNPYTLLGDTAVCHIAAVIPDSYPVDCDGHVSFLTLGNEPLFGGGIRLEGGHAILPDGPGLGIHVDWAAVGRHSSGAN
jgi:L-alanine-DL-glutamate epimerase-like enolase superfamily enzyme